jgi:hypothetical protein
MKKIYNQPTCLVVELSSRNAIMAISGQETLSGTSWGGKTSEAAGGTGISEGDVKGITDVNVWDNEW